MSPSCIILLLILCSRKISFPSAVLQTDISAGFFKSNDLVQKPVVAFSVVGFHTLKILVPDGSLFMATFSVILYHFFHCDTVNVARNSRFPFFTGVGTGVGSD